MIARRDLLRLSAGASLIAFLPAALRAATAAQHPSTRMPAAPIDLRVRDLLSRMTLEEKVAQTVTLSRTKRDVMDDALRFDPMKASAAYPQRHRPDRSPLRPGAARPPPTTPPMTPPAAGARPPTPSPS